MTSKNDPPVGFVENPQQYPPMQPPLAHRVDTPPPPYPLLNPLESPPTAEYENTTSQDESTHQVSDVEQLVGGSEKVSDYLCLSVFSIFFCCIVGAMATVNAVDARAAKRRGDTAMASSSAKTARSLAILAITLGLILATITIHLLNQQLLHRYR